MINLCSVQLYWGAKSELGQVVTRLSEVYESAKRDAVTKLQQVGMETVAIGNTDVNNGTGQLYNVVADESLRNLLHRMNVREEKIHLYSASL